MYNSPVLLIMSGSALYSPVQYSLCSWLLVADGPNQIYDISVQALAGAAAPCHVVNQDQ